MPRASVANLEFARMARGPGSRMAAAVLASAMAAGALLGVPRGAVASDPEPASPSPPTLKVVFAAVDREPYGETVGPPQLYTANEDGTDLRRLTWDDGSSYDWPMWAMAGNKIVFTAVQGQDRDGDQGIYLMDPDGTNQERIARTRGRTVQPRVSPDGRSLVFTSSWEEFPIVAIYRMDLTTLQVENLSAVSSPEVGLDTDPKWSSDGKSIVFITGPVEDGVLHESQVYIMNADGTGRRPLTADRYWHTDPSLSPDGQLVATSTYRGTNPAFLVVRRGLLPHLADWHLLVKDVATGDERVLTEGKPCVLRQAQDPLCHPAEGPAWVPQWSPDGKRIAYLSARSSGLGGLYVMDADGSNARPLIESLHRAIVWYDWVEPGGPPGGTIENIGRATPGSSILYGARRLPTQTDVAGNFVAPDSSDGAELSAPRLFASTPDRWQSQEVVSERADLVPESARWTPDRRHIVFTARLRSEASTARPEPPEDQLRRVHVFFGVASAGTVRLQEPAPEIQEQVFLMEADGSNVRQLTTPWTEDLMDAIPDEEVRGNSDPDISPDGRFLVFANVSGATHESWILRMDLATGEVINLTSVTCGPAVCVDRSPRFSPDGSRIAFHSLIGDTTQVLVMDASGRNVRQLTDDDHASLQPAWSPDGRWLAYVSFRPSSSDGQEEVALSDSLPLGAGEGGAPSGRWDLLKLNVETGQQVLLTSDGESPISQPVWSPDGGRIAYLGFGGGKQPDIYILGADGTNPRPLAVTTTTLEQFFDWR